MTDTALRRFATDYAAHRAAEGRGHSGKELFALPYLRSGPLARQWEARASSFEALMRQAVRPMASALGRRLRAVDLGAGNGWLSFRLALEGHRATAVDIRDDCVDGLGASQAFLEAAQGRMDIFVASFDEIPAADGAFDMAVFNASLHYATDLAITLAEAMRVVRRGGRLIILDSPFYRREVDGLAMLDEKRAGAADRFGARAGSLMSLPFIEFLTRERLQAVSDTLGLNWRRHRVRYPLWYELRPLAAALKGRRPPSRFDLWIATRP